MLRWIAKRRHESDKKTIHTLEEGRLAADVIHYRRCCGHQGFVVELFAFEDFERINIGLVAEEDSAAMIQLLQDSRKTIKDFEKDGKIVPRWLRNGL